MTGRPYAMQAAMRENRSRTCYSPARERTIPASADTTTSTCSYRAGSRRAGVNCQVLLEPIIPTLAGIRKPDLVVSRRGKALVLDSTVVADAGVANLTTAYDRKALYYRQPDIEAWVRQASGADDVTTGAVVVSWRGAFCAKSDELL